MSVEDVSAAALGVDHLISMGHRRIAIVTGPLSLRNERERLLGYQQSLSRAGLAAEDELIWHGNLRPEDVASMCRTRLRALDSKLDAIFSTNGPTGLGVLRAFRDCGLSTPEDIAFATFDELTVEDLFKPSITTVVQPAYDIGYRAAEILLKRIEQSETSDQPVTVRLPATLKIGESSRLAAKLAAKNDSQRMVAGN